MDCKEVHTNSGLKTIEVGVCLLYDQFLTGGLLTEQMIRSVRT